MPEGGNKFTWTPGSGHYTADTLQDDGRWLRFDDESMAAASARQVLQETEDACLLWYVRRELKVIEKVIRNKYRASVS